MLPNLEQLQDSTPSADFSALIAGISWSIKFLMMQMLLMWTRMHGCLNEVCRKRSATVLMGPYNEVDCHCQRLDLAKFQN